MAGVREHRGKSALLLTGFAVASVMPVVPSTWHGWMVVAASILLLVAVVVRDPAVVSLVLFCTIMPAGVVFNPWRSWPMHLLAPLAAYALIVGAIPALRRATLVWQWGRFDRGTAALSALTVVVSSGVLVLWTVIARPDVSDLHAMIPPWPTWALPLAGLGFAVINAVMEEAIWRGILWELLRRVLPATWAVILLQAVSFGLIHLGGFPRGWVGVGLATLYGVFLGLIRHRANGLAAPIVAHVFADVTIFAILVFGIASSWQEAG